MHAAPAEAAAEGAVRQGAAQQQPQAGFTPADFSMSEHTRQQALLPRDQPSGRHLDWTAQAPHQPAIAAAPAATVARQPAVQADRDHAPSHLLSANTSGILGQQAQQWRQAASKRSALADLIPASKAFAPQQASQGAPGLAHELNEKQASTAQQGCEAFKPVVQACIDAASLPLANPFYQQALERAMEQQPQRQATLTVRGLAPDSAVNMKGAAPVANDQCRAGPPSSSDCDAQAAADATVQEQQVAQDVPKHSAHAEQLQPARQLEEAVPAALDDVDLGTDFTDEAGKDKARTYISQTRWDRAIICGEEAIASKLT